MNLTMSGFFNEVLKIKTKIFQELRACLASDITEQNKVVGC
jgi:hypothetical protein